MKYEIDKPTPELMDDYFTLALKYLTLSIVGFFVGWIIVTVFAMRIRGNIPFSAFIISNPGVTSIAIAFGVIYFFGRRTYEKYKLGLLTSIEFDEDKQVVNMELFNTFNGGIRKKEIGFAQLRTNLSISEDKVTGKLYGKQRIIEFYCYNVLINRLNIELTAWCRNEQIDALVNRLEKFSK